MQLDLFNIATEEVDSDDKIRTIGFYQPFGSLMHHGKIETRWVMKGKKPPFPKGKYVFYTTQKVCEEYVLFDWCGLDLMSLINETLKDDLTRDMTEVALSCGELVDIRLMTKEDEQKAFVKFVGERDNWVDGIKTTQCQWCLVFDNVISFEPFEWRVNGKSAGKQGVGFLPDAFKAKIENYFSK